MSQNQIKPNQPQMVQQQDQQQQPSAPQQQAAQRSQNAITALQLAQMAIGKNSVYSLKLNTNVLRTRFGNCVPHNRSLSAIQTTSISQWNRNDKEHLQRQTKETN